MPYKHAVWYETFAISNSGILLERAYLQYKTGLTKFTLLILSKKEIGSVQLRSSLGVTQDIVSVMFHCVRFALKISPEPYDKF